jgi:hypothetical protein
MINSAGDAEIYLLLNHLILYFCAKCQEYEF